MGWIPAGRGVATVGIVSIGLGSSFAIESSRWRLGTEGSLVWVVKQGDAPHLDHIEASGQRVSLVLHYGTSEAGKLVKKIFAYWPMLRMIPNDTFGHLWTEFTPEMMPRLLVDGKEPIEKLESARLDGVVTLESHSGNLVVRRRIFPCRTAPVVVERIFVRNSGANAVKIELAPANRKLITDAAKGVQGAYILEALPSRGGQTVPPGQEASISISYMARPVSEPPAKPLNEKSEESKRLAFVASLGNTLVLETPDPVINRMFAFAKVRAAESIFATKGGKIHCPGGGTYYAAIWANDQAEYANPFFGYLGNSDALEASSNAFDWFAKYMNPEYRPIPSSIIAEGTSFWNGAGDRGDMAMIAYGACRYVMARGSREEAEKIWPLIAWCLEYLDRKLTPEGVIASDSDELENRFPAGKANLNTSSLAYDALTSAASLAEELGKPEADRYRLRAERLRASIESYFGHEVEGFQTYRYYEGNDTLRAWICTPLVMGISNRSAGTVEALFSPRLWTVDGLATQAGDKTFWDRSTLYGFRGAFAAGATDRAMPFLEAYTLRRLLGDHVPYAIEAWPEGNQRQLSAESALYCRAFTEGMFGIRPLGLRKFSILPRLPKTWGQMSLRKVAIAGNRVDIKVQRKGHKVVVRVTSEGSNKETFEVGDQPHICHMIE